MPKCIFWNIRGCTKITEVVLWFRIPAPALSVLPHPCNSHGLGLISIRRYVLAILVVDERHDSSSLVGTRYGVVNCYGRIAYCYGSLVRCRMGITRP